MQENKKRKIVILSICAITLMLAGILSTYAYFMVSVNNDRRQEAEIDTGTMILRFADGDEGINATLLPNESIIKKFTLENTGTLDATVSIEWLDMINTYTEGSLTYTLEYSESQDGEYTEIVNKTNVPTSNTEFTSTLVPDITIPVGKTYYYNLEITFNDLEGIDQTSDYDAKFVTRFVVSQPSTNRKYTLTIDPNGGTMDGSSDVQTYNLDAEDTQTVLTPVNGGTKFIGWRISGYGSSLNEDSITIGKTNTQVIAEWEPFNVVEAVKDISDNKTPKGVMSHTPDFESPALTDEGVFVMKDDYGTSYYYRGAVENNYLKFGDFWWRIIRVNGDGSVRVIYDGDRGYQNGINNENRLAYTLKAFNSVGQDAKYIGWMYSPAGTTASTSAQEAQTNTTSSSIKNVVDNWYKTNVIDKNLSQYISDEIFCNDRSISIGVGYGLNSTYYMTHHRTTSYEPQFVCSNKNDAFTMSDSIKGNAKLMYPIGLITVDEAVAAGGKFNVPNQKYFLYKGMWYWTISPYYIYSGGSAQFVVNNNGLLHNTHVANASGAIDGSENRGGGVAPVINLKAEFVKTMIGTGTITDPYRAE